METDKITEMRSIINNSLKKLANNNPNVSFVNIEQEEEEDRKVNWNNDRHMNERFVTHVLGKICDKMSEPYR